MIRGNIFNPQGFPYPRGLDIPAAEVFILPALFSPGLGHIEGVFRPDGNVIFPVLYKMGNVEGKPGIAPLVPARMIAVYPYIRIVIAALKAEDNLFRPPDPQGNPAVVPNHVVPGGVPDAAGGTFIAEGNPYLFGSREFFIPASRKAGVFVVKGKIPGAVQVFPGLGIPHKLGTGIIGLITLHDSISVRIL
jgi:hypothetical protein